MGVGNAALIMYEIGTRGTHQLLGPEPHLAIKEKGICLYVVGFELPLALSAFCT